MRRFIILAALVAAAPAGAQRLDTTAMSCGEARSVIARNGAAVLHSGPYIYDRYVAGNQFCAVGELTRQAFAPTRDNPICPVGATCVTPETLRKFPD